MVERDPESIKSTDSGFPLPMASPPGTMETFCLPYNLKGSDGFIQSNKVASQRIRKRPEHTCGLPYR
jgi:hypothetical protein